MARNDPPHDDPHDDAVDPGPVRRSDGGTPGDDPGPGDDSDAGDDPWTGDGPGTTDPKGDPSPDTGVAAGTPETDPDEILQEVERKRSLTGLAAVLVSVVAVSFSAFQMWIAARGFTFEVTAPVVGTVRFASLYFLQVNAIHVTFALVLTFLVYPSSTGEGAVVRRLESLPGRARERFGAGNPLVAASERLWAAVRWGIVDRERRRVTPADVLLILLALLPPLYMLTEFQEISDVIRYRGLEGARPLGEVYPVLDPIAVGPLADTSWAFVLGVVGVLLVLEATRRALGLLLMGLVVLFIVYARFGFMLPRGAPVVGTFAITDLGWPRIVRSLWYNTEAGINGRIVAVSVRFIYIFILFGAFLEMSGAGEWFIDLAYSLTGTRRGGPAKASVVSSGFMGMLSGSSVANTVTTGAFTIPLMKQSGYSPEFSGAVESSASSGGQILPPVMGAAAFLIVDFTGTPYREVIVAAMLPALAFFFGMWVMVHFEAVRRGVGGLDRADLLDVRPHLKRGWFYVVPIALLLYYLVVARLSINRAGWFTIVATVALVALVAAYDEGIRVPFVGVLAAVLAATAATQYLAGTTIVGYLLGVRAPGEGAGNAVVAAAGAVAVPLIVVSVAVMLWRRRTTAPLLDLDPSVDRTAEQVDEKLGREVATTRPGRFGTFVLRSMDAGARTATIVVVAVAAAGVIPGVISVSGLGPNLTRLIIVVSGESFVLLLVLAGISAIILGMGMPTTVMYIILVSVMGGALAEFGVALLAAHLFVLYLGLMADVTPPVMVAAYAAAGVAKSDPFETGKLAFLLSLNKIMVPFAFVFAPGILLIRDWDPAAGELTLVSWADVVDPGFFLPEVLVPVVGMFAGVYALGVTIIGYRSTYVPRVDRALYSVSSLLLMVPALVLSPADVLLAVAGTEIVASTLAADLALRAAGGALLVALIVRDRNRESGETADRGPDVDAGATAPGVEG